MVEHSELLKCLPMAIRDNKNQIARVLDIADWLLQIDEEHLPEMEFEEIDELLEFRPELTDSARREWEPVARQKIEQQLEDFRESADSRSEYKEALNNQKKEIDDKLEDLEWLGKAARKTTIQARIVRVESLYQLNKQVLSKEIANLDFSTKGLGYKERIEKLELRDILHDTDKRMAYINEELRKHGEVTWAETFELYDSLCKELGRENEYSSPESLKTAYHNRFGEKK